MNWRETYIKELESKGREESNLLGVIPQALHHNFPNSYNLAIIVGLRGEGMDEVEKMVASRVGLVNRHLNDVQLALQEIHELAKSRGYEDILQIFQRTYHIGHPRREPTTSGE